MNGRTAKSFSRDTLKKGGERIWKSPKQHVSLSKHVPEKWEDCQRRGLILAISSCEAADVFHEFSVNLDR